MTHFIAISRTIQDRIRECYGRDSVVIYPPVDTDFYHPAPVPREDYYLVVSAFAPYKRHRPGGGGVPAARPEAGRHRHRAGRAAAARAGRPAMSTFLGWQSDEVIRDHFRRCRALLFPGEEDFGIVPVEAQACGTPVIAFGRGGAAETVIPPGH